MNDELARIMADDQAATQRREARKFVESLAADVNAYHAALSGQMTPALRERLTGDFGPKWHTYQLEEAEVDLAILYAEGDE